jgi:hypothetical protein
MKKMNNVINAGASNQAAGYRALRENHPEKDILILSILLQGERRSAPDICD